MGFLLTNHHLAKQEEFRSFAKKELDRDSSYPAANLQNASARGYMGMHVAKEWGGAGEDYLTYILLIEEVSRICPSTGVILSVHSSVGTNPILYYGSREQKEKYLPGLASGDLLAAFALTEESAGSDAAALTTAASKVENGFILNGNKIFITSGGIADLYIVFTKMNRDLGSAGITAFIVEKGTEGLSYGKPEKKMGLNRSCTTGLQMDNLFLADSFLLGNEGEGFAIAKSVLDGGRIGIAAQGIGLAQATLDRTVEIIKANAFSARHLNEVCGFTVADLATELEAARLMVYYAALMKGKDIKCAREASMAKVIATDTAVRIATKCIDIASIMGAGGDKLLLNMFCDAKVLQIYEGTNQVQRIVISRELLKQD